MNNYEEGISIIIPVYNTEQYLNKCLNSIMVQTFEKFEVIIVNDGSIDNSQSIIEKYINLYPKKIKYFKQVNSGQSIARNLALKYVTKEYITFLDSDDYIDKNYLYTLYKCAKKNNSDMVCSGQEKVDINGRCICRIQYSPDHKGNCIMRRLNFAGKLYKTTFLMKNFNGFAKGKTYEDNPFNLRMFFLAKNLQILKYVGYYQLVHEGSTTASKIKRETLPFYEIQKTLEYMNNNKKSVNNWELYEFTVMSFFTYFTFEANRNHHYLKMPSDIRKSDMKVLLDVCDFTHHMMKRYFPYFYKNKYLNIWGPKELELKQRLGTYVFSILCKYNIIKVFARIYYRFT